MEQDALQKQIARFLSNLQTGVRQATLYPPKHPIVVESFKQSFDSLTQILAAQPQLTISVSADQKLLINGQSVSGKGWESAEDFLRYLKRLDVESLTFSTGTTREEIDGFLKLLMVDDSAVKDAGSLASLFVSSGITHIAVGQYSYVKVDKDKEALLVESGSALLDKLKSLVKDFGEGKLKSPEEVELVTKELFSQMGQELKEKHKVGVPLKNLFKKFIRSSDDKERACETAKASLCAAGCGTEDVEALIVKIRAEAESLPRPRSSTLLKEEAEQLKKENEELEGLLDQLRKKDLFAERKEEDLLAQENAALKKENDGLKEQLAVFSRASEAAASVTASTIGEAVQGYDALKAENEKLRTTVDELSSQLHEHLQESMKLVRETTRVASEKERIDNIVRHMADGLVVVDPAGKILLMNSQAESLLGVRQGDIGKPIKEFIRNDYLLTLVKNIPQEKDEIVEKDIELLSGNEATKKVLRTSSAVVEDHNGKTVGMVTILNDVTKQKELEHLKSNFVSNVSHELRTPLVAIDKSLSLLLNKSTGQISDTQEQFLGIAQRNLKRLSVIINDLLDLSKLEAGKMRFSFVNCSLGKVVSETVEALQLWAKTKAITLTATVPDGLLEALIDPDRVAQVLNNLVGNSLKFTSAQGRIEVQVSFSAETDSFTVCVSDTGIGFDESEAQKIFDKFYQAREKDSGDIKGTGIGLAIAKEIVEAHGGTIWAHGTRGSGAQVSFTLPRRQANGGPETAAGESAA